jgi:hypothetical protein
MTNAIRCGLLAGLLLGTLVFVTGCGNSKSADPKPVANPDQRIQRVGIGADPGKGGAPEQGAKPKVNASTN